MVLDRLYTVDGISSSHWLSGKQFMMSFSRKMEFRWINSSPSLSKWLAMINFSAFYCLSDFLYTFGKTISVMRSSHPFLKLLYYSFWAWRPNNFSSIFLKLSSNFQHSLLRSLRGYYFQKLKKISVTDDRS